MTIVWQPLEINGGTVDAPAPGHFRLALPVVEGGYADAQIDDYRGRSRRQYGWRPGTSLYLRARFSHPAAALVGTAGFGFWNAPFGPGTGLIPSLPQAAWFFFASEPSDLPLAPFGEAGRGWFAATLDAGTPRALSCALPAPVLLLFNQLPALRKRLWPLIRRALNISFKSLDLPMTEWHTYHLQWQDNGCFFQVDGQPVLQTPFRPHGPLGFVAWLDNQYLVLTATGRMGWGTLPVPQPQWLEISHLQLDRTV